MFGNISKIIRVPRIYYNIKRPKKYRVVSRTRCFDKLRRNTGFSAIGREGSLSPYAVYCLYIIIQFFFFFSSSLPLDSIQFCRKIYCHSIIIGKYDKVRQESRYLQGTGNGVYAARQKSEENPTKRTRLEETVNDFVWTTM